MQRKLGEIRFSAGGGHAHRKAALGVIEYQPVPLLGINCKLVNFPDCQVHGAYTS